MTSFSAVRVSSQKVGGHEQRHPRSARSDMLPLLSEWLGVGIALVRQLTLPIQERLGREGSVVAVLPFLPYRKEMK